MRTLREYRVRWEIDLYATSPREAAERALEIQRDPKSIATAFDVYRRDISGETDVMKLLAKSEPVHVDLEEYRRRIPKRGRRAQ